MSSTKGQRRARLLTGEFQTLSIKRVQTPEERPFEPSDLIRVSHDRLDPAGVYLMGTCSASAAACGQMHVFLTRSAHGERRYRLVQRTACL